MAIPDPLPPGLEGRSLPMSPRNPYLLRESEPIQKVRFPILAIYPYTDVALYERWHYKRGFRGLYVQNFSSSLVIGKTY